MSFEEELENVYSWAMFGISEGIETDGEIERITNFRDNCLDKQKVKEAFLKIFNKGKRMISEDKIIVSGALVAMVYKELKLK